MIEEYRKNEVRSKKIIRIILASCIVILVLLLLIKLLSGIRKTVMLPIKKVQIYGNTYIQNNEIVKIIDLDTGRSILFFNRKRAKLSLLQDKRISGIEIVKEYPDTLRIYIAEKEKKFLIKFLIKNLIKNPINNSLMDAEHTYWLSSEGVILKETTGRDLEMFPFITINVNNDDIRIGDLIDNFMVAGILSSIKEIENVYPEFYKRIHSFSVNERGIYVRFKDNNYRVYLGNTITREKCEKLRALILVLENLYPDMTSDNEILEIDLSFSNAAVRKREFKNDL